MKTTKTTRDGTANTGNKLKHLALAAAIGAMAFFGTGPAAQAALIGQWVAGAESLMDTSAFTPAATHDGIAVGTNAAMLAYSADVPPSYTGKSLDLTAGNVGVMIDKTANTDTGYLNTYDDPIRDQFTLAFWAKGIPGSWNPYLAKDGATNGWQFRRMSGDPYVSLTIRGNVGNADGTASGATNVNDSPPKWHHYAEVWNKATGTRTLYVDGVVSHVVTNTPTTQQMNLAPTNHLTLGARQPGASTTYEAFFPGLLFDVRIYDTPLTQSEVVAMVPPAVPEGLVVTPGAGKMFLTWAPTPRATSYTVWSKNSVTEAVVETDVATVTSFSLTGLTNGELYSFKILAKNIAGTTTSAEVTATPAMGTAKEMISFGFGTLGAATISGLNIVKHVPLATDVTTLVPTYAVSPYAAGDATYPSGNARNFTTPQAYTVTAEDGTTQAYSVTVIKSAPFGYDFNSGLQGWTQIYPAPPATGLWEAGHLGAASNDVQARWARSPEFYLSNLSDLTFELAGGQSPLAAPASPPPSSASSGGFAGVALRDVESNTYVLSKRRTGTANTYAIHSFTLAELAPYASDTKRYTLDYIDYFGFAGSGWTTLDNVTIPGTLVPAADITKFGLFRDATVVGTDITLPVYEGTPVEALAPTYTLSPGATCAKASGSTQDFSGLDPVIYTVVSSDGEVTKEYFVTVVFVPKADTALIGQWGAGAETLADTSGVVATAGLHNGVAVGSNAAALAYSPDTPAAFNGKSLNLTAGNVAVKIDNTAGFDAGYLNTYDDPIRSQFTLAFWAKGFPASWSPFVSKDGESNGWQFRRYSGDPNACLTMRGLGNADGGGSATPVNDGQWHHFAEVWNQVTNTRTLYVDGMASHVVSTPLGQNYNLAPTRNLVLGGKATNAAAGPATFGSYFAGLLFDVRVYNRSLFADEVQTLLTPATPQTPAANIKTFGLAGMPAIVGDSSIVWSLPVGMSFTALAPTFTMSNGATCDKTSGATYDFSAPVTYTVTSSDSLIVKPYTVTVVSGNTFDDGTLQGWHNRVWDATAGAWVDLDPNVTVMPATINGGVIQPPSGNNNLWKSTNGIIQPTGGNNDNHLNTLWLRSPVFYPNGSGDLTAQLVKGYAHGPAPLDELSVPFAAIQDGGWMGLALRRVSDGVFLLTKSRTENNDTPYLATFTAAELAPYVGVACTLDLINADKGSWGWQTMDNVMIPGTSVPVTPADPFGSWINTNYPTLSDKSPGGDPDGDGMSNQREFAFGLDPSNGTSANPITAQVEQATGMFSYTRRATPVQTGLIYTVWTSLDLQTWTKDAGAIQTAGTPVAGVETVSVQLSGTVPLGATTLFVRVKAQ